MDDAEDRRSLTSRSVVENAENRRSLASRSGSDSVTETCGSKRIEEAMEETGGIGSVRKGGRYLLSTIRCRRFKSRLPNC